MLQLTINSNAVVAHASRLERMSRSALPVAVRQTLNSAAFDVKKTTMPAMAGKTFVKRKPNFFKANSKVDQAKGFEVNNMEATVGFTGKDQAVEDLEQQERGGKIGGRAFIPLKQARVGSSWNKNVKAANRISDIKSRVIESKNAKGKNDKTRFVKSAIHAGKGGYVIGNNVKGGNKFLFQIKGLKKVNRKTVVKAVPLFAVKKNRSVSPPATHFMRKASEQSADKMTVLFKNHAEKLINRTR